MSLASFQAALPREDPSHGWDSNPEPSDQCQEDGTDELKAAPNFVRNRIGFGQDEKTDTQHLRDASKQRQPADPLPDRGLLLHHNHPRPNGGGRYQWLPHGVKMRGEEISPD
jgi:hypothetical protein